jgi:peptidoglycan/xylan/chitin deacetylase (PgdA/CDA1 family)
MGAAARTPFRWPAGAQAAVSLTYDDGLNSQLDYAVPALATLGLRATFFLTGDNARPRMADWAAVARQGHELADHTVTHPCELKGVSGTDFRRREVEPMEALLDRTVGPGLRSFAYPCGMTGLGAGDAAVRRARFRDLLRPRFLLARTVEGGPEDPRRVVADRYRLPAFEPTYESDDPAAGLAYLERALNRGAWAVLVFHEVLPARRGEGDTSVAVHRSLLERVASGPFWCAPLGEAFRYAAARA